MLHILLHHKYGNSQSVSMDLSSCLYFLGMNIVYHTILKCKLTCFLQFSSAILSAPVKFPSCLSQTYHS